MLLSWRFSTFSCQRCLHAVLHANYAGLLVHLSENLLRIVADPVGGAAAAFMALLNLFLQEEEEALVHLVLTCTRLAHLVLTVLG
jgi:hypothetical protein